MATLIELSVGWIQPCATSRRRPVSRQVVAKLGLDPVVARDPLIRPATEPVQDSAVAADDVFKDVAALIVPRRGDGMQRARRVHDERRRLPCESFVDINFGSRRVVYHQERHVVEVVRFPELRGDANVVCSVAGCKLVAADLDPVFRLTDARRVLGIDTQAQGRSPDKIGDEPHGLAVERIQKWT